MNTLFSFAKKIFFPFSSPEEQTLLGKASQAIENLKQNKATIHNEAVLAECIVNLVYLSSTMPELKRSAALCLLALQERLGEEESLKRIETKMHEILDVEKIPFAHFLLTEEAQGMPVKQRKKLMLNCYRTAHRMLRKPAPALPSKRALAAFEKAHAPTA